VDFLHKEVKMSDVKYTSKDVEKLQRQFKADFWRKRTKEYCVMIWVLLGVMVLVLVGAGILGSKLIREHKEELIRIRAETTELIDSNRIVLTRSLYTVSQVLTEEIPVRSERMEKFVKEAKGVVLEVNPGTDFTDRELNAFLIQDFRYAEAYMVNPWISIAFMQAESDFTKDAESSAGALGPFQFMPMTMKLVLGDEYSPGAEKNPLLALKAWYRYFMICSNTMGGDLKWSAAQYMSPKAYVFKQRGDTVDDFMKWIASVSDNHERYPYVIEEYFERYSKR